MGKRGPAPAPTPLKIVRGDRSSRVGEAELRPEERKCPTAPSWLSSGAKLTWNRLAPDLFAKGVLTWWDREAFAVLVDAMNQYRLAAEEVGDEIMVGKVKHPALQVKRDSAQTILSYSARFGLTPSDRQNLSIGKESDEDEARRLLS